jgi:hypothetical protein
VETSNLTMWTYLKILSPGPVLHGTKWLLWRPHK